MSLTRIKTITSHAGHARFLAECGDQVGTIPRQIRTPHAYSQTHLVYDWKGVPVVIAETQHRRYEVYRVDGPLGPVED